MWKLPKDDNLFEKFSKYIKIIAVIFMILGLVGIIYPVFMTLATVTFVAWLMLIAGLMSGYFTWLINKEDMLGWFKSFILIAASLFMLYSPMGGAATISFLFSIYFFFNGFVGFSLALSMRPHVVWIFWLINAIFSVLIALMLILGWPASSMYLVGLLVGFSLFFDGIALFIGGSIFTNMMK
jgi:membrane protein HdeD